MSNISLFKVLVEPEVIPMVSNVLQSGYIAQGPKTAEFEKSLCEFLGVPWAATVNSGTSALHLALHLVKTKYHLTPYTEVLTVPLTCAATSFAIEANNLRIKWVDVDPKTCNMDLHDLKEKADSTQVGAVMLVHWGGLPIDVAAVKKVLKSIGREDLPIIEDCAHAFGVPRHDATYRCYSFQAIKTLSTGDGGLLVCPDAEENARARRLRWFGLDRDNGASFRAHQDIPQYGFKFQMNDIAAAIGLGNLPAVPARLAAARRNAEAYIDALQHIKGLKLLSYYPKDSSNWLFTVLVQRRADFMAKLKEAGIETNPVHARNDELSCLSKYRGWYLENLGAICEDIVCLPVGPWVTSEDIQHIIDTIRKGW